MSNMAHCRFQNTLDDLRECKEILEELGDDLSSLSAEESKASVQLIWLCKRMADMFDVD